MKERIKPQNTNRSEEKTPFFRSGNEHASIDTQSRDLFFKVTGAQAKLKVGSPGDAYEREAEQIADKVTQSSDNSLQSGKIFNNNSTQETSAQPLPDSIRHEMENKLGEDFSKVRIHTGSEAARLNSQLNSKAFTFGNNIFFNKDQYNPQIVEGKRLLAHELTHVSQQRSIQPKIQRQQEDAIEFGIGEGEFIKAGQESAQPSVQDYASEDVQVYKNRLKTYLRNTQHAINEAYRSFGNTMFSESTDDAIPSLMSTVLSSGFDIVKSKILDRVPGATQAFEMIEAINNEVQRAQEAFDEVQLVSWINASAAASTDFFNDEIARLEEDDFVNNLLNWVVEPYEPGNNQSVHDSWNRGIYLRRTGEMLLQSYPSVQDVLATITQSYIRNIRNTRNTSWPGGLQETGVIFLRYIIDEESNEANLVQSTLASPYASQLKDAFRESGLSPLDTANLDIDRIIVLYSRQNRFKYERHILRPNIKAPGHGTFGLFNQYVESMPMIALHDLTTARWVYQRWGGQVQ